MFREEIPGKKSKRPSKGFTALWFPNIFLFLSFVNNNIHHNSVKFIKLQTNFLFNFKETLFKLKQRLSEDINETGKS